MYQHLKSGIWHPTQTSAETKAWWNHRNHPPVDDSPPVALWKRWLHGTRFYKFYKYNVGFTQWFPLSFGDGKPITTHDLHAMAGIFHGQISRFCWASRRRQSRRSPEPLSLQRGCASLGSLQLQTSTELLNAYGKSGFNHSFSIMI